MRTKKTTIDGYAAVLNHTWTEQPSLHIYVFSPSHQLHLACLGCIYEGGRHRVAFAPFENLSRLTYLHMPYTSS